jgi:voltage-gated potassium channel
MEESGKRAGKTVRKRVWELLDVARPGDGASRVFDVFILTLIALNVLAVILATVEPLGNRYRTFFDWFEVFSVAVFTVEYAGRLWASPEGRTMANPFSGRLRFMAEPMSVIDLLAFLPFYLSFIGADLRFLRAFRLFRIFRVAKLGRYSSSFRLLARVLTDRKEELAMTFLLLLILVITSSSLMYFAEHGVQPDKFPDIPSAMWWSVITMTTVGYGDVYPVTLWGKFFAALSAVFGIGMFALPTGIIGAGFVEEIQKSRTGGKRCPHCGKIL